MESAPRRSSRVIRSLIRIYLSFGACHLIAKLLSRWLKARRLWAHLQDVPRARYAPFLGGVGLEFVRNRHRIHEWRREMTLGLPVSKFRGLSWDPDLTYLVVSDPAGVKHILKDAFENYSKPAPERFPIFFFLNKWLGDGIFVTRHGSAAPQAHESWLRQRKIASNIFSRGNFNTNMQEVFAHKAEQLTSLLEGPAAAGEAVDMQAKFFQFTMDSIMQIFFGETADSIGGQENAYGKAFDDAHQGIISYMLSALPVLVPMALMPWPLGGQNGLLWRLHGAVHPHMRSFKAAYKVLDAESRRLLEACRHDPQLPLRRDLLALFVQHGAEGSGAFSPEMLRDVILNFIIAGRDTTACTLSWMFYVLSVNPEVQRKLQRELDAKLGDSTGWSFRDLGPNELPYLNGVLYETLRLFPPVPTNIKEAAENDQLPDGTPVPQHVKLVYVPYSMGRDPERYPEPLVVRPERWIPFASPAPHEFPVFQAGPRICLGMDMAIFEAKFVACALLRRFSFELKPGEAEKITYSNTLTMSVCNSKTQDSANLWLLPRLRASGTSYHGC